MYKIGNKLTNERILPLFIGIDYDGRSAAGECCLYDIDPELIRKSVRKLMQQVAQVEREKEEYKVQLQTARKELDDAANQQTRCENKISKLQQILRNANEEKASLESKLTQKQLALQSVEDAHKLKSDELNGLIDKYKSLELQHSSLMEQKSQTEVSKINLLNLFCTNFNGLLSLKIGSSGKIQTE